MVPYLDRKLRGILLAGGRATRLHPITKSISKHLLPVYDKPMIYYPLSVLMIASIRDILVISAPANLQQLRMLLGDGSQWGIKLSYAEQAKPDGIVQANLIAGKFLDGGPVMLDPGGQSFLWRGADTAPQSRWCCSHYVFDRENSRARE